MNGADGDNPASRSFGRWRLDAGTGDLFDGETTTRLEPQVAKLLDYFLTHQDTLHSRDDLIGAVWENRIVSDDAINRCISILRHTLSPDDKNAFIETVVRRGFVSHFPPPPAEPLPTEQRPRLRNYVILAALAAAEGDTEEAERLVRVWLREASRDLAELAFRRHQACRALGMAAASSAAVECIRSGLTEPSWVMPFVEPFLPYYDALRNEREFVDLLAEIQAQ